MLNNFSFLSIVFELTLFVIVATKIYSLYKRYILPLIKQIIRKNKEFLLDLQEKISVLAFQKKTASSQLLQQEKQIALLYVKLDKWYKGWQTKKETLENSLKTRIEKAKNETIRNRALANTEQKNNLLLLESLKEIKEELCSLDEAKKQHYFTSALNKYKQAISHKRELL